MLNTISRLASESTAACSWLVVCYVVENEEILAKNLYRETDCSMKTLVNYTFIISFSPLILSRALSFSKRDWKLSQRGSTEFEQKAKLLEIL